MKHIVKQFPTQSESAGKSKTIGIKCGIIYELDGVGPVDNKPSTD